MNMNKKVQFIHSGEQSNTQVALIKYFNTEKEYEVEIINTKERGKLKGSDYAIFMYHDEWIV